MISKTERSSFAISLLGKLREAEVPYALLRNFEEVIDGSYKDIDLICPPLCARKIIAIIKAQDNVRGLKVIQRYSRCQVSIRLEERVGNISVDLDFQLPMAEVGFQESIFSKLGTKTIIFSDLGTREISVSGIEIILLDQPSEILTLKHHCLIKPKEKYKNRIAELRRLGYREKEKALVLRSKMLNFPRRTLVVGKAVFLWAGNRFSMWEKLFI